MVGIYLSGTGNTKWCVERLIHHLNEQAQAIPIEDIRIPQSIRENQTIILAYPVQYSNVPLMIRDFIKNHADCVGCSECSRLCPMKNITMHDGKPFPGNRFTMCYRCISKCPKKAITLIGKQVHEQCRIERYV